MRVYWTSIEFKLKPSHKEFKKFKGGFVYLFVKTTDDSTALEKFKKELYSLKLIPLEIEFVKQCQNLEWENERQEEHFRAIIKEAKNTSEVVIDDFYMYERTE